MYVIMECIEIDLNNVCRTCKNKCPEMKSLYCRGSESGKESPRLDEMLMACTSVQVNNEDDLPKSICQSCLVRLKNAYSFKEQCEKTDLFLRDHLKNLKKDTIKQEIITDLEQHSSSFIGEINSALDDIGNISSDKSIENIKGELESHFDGSRQENVDYIQIVNNNLTIYECCTCSKVLYTLEDVKCHKRVHTDDIEENDMEMDFENATMFSDEADGGDDGDDLLVDREKVKPKMEVSESNDQEKIREVTQTANEVYAEEDPLPILMKTKIDEEMYRVTEVKQEGMEINEKEAEVKEDGVDVNNDSEYESDASTDSEYLPTKEKIKRGPGRPRKHPVSLRLTDRSRKRPRLVKVQANSPKNDIGNFPCSQCKEIFTKPTLLEKHAEQHDALQIHKCDSCDKRFSTLNNLKRHKLLHMEVRPFLCMTCRKTFTRNDHLQRHMKFHLKKPIHSCDLCDAVFSRQGNLTKHKDTKHNNSEKIVKEKKKFGCSECGKEFIRNDYLVTHMRRHRGEKPCKCKYCGKGFPRTADLTVHVRYHTGEKTHLCVTCGRRFGRACDLKVHTRTHTGEKPYRCTYCDAAFAQGNDLRAHIRKHTGERFHCELCPKTFIMRYLLTQHKRVVHGLNIVGNQRRLQPVNKLEADEPQLIIDTDPLQSQEIEVSESRQ